MAIHRVRRVRQVLPCTVLTGLLALLSLSCEPPTRSELPTKPAPVDTTTLPPNGPPFAPPAVPPRVATRLTGGWSGAFAITPRGEATLVPPDVIVLDQHGRGMPNVRVNFVVTEGSSTIATPVAFSGMDGRAIADAWIIGPEQGRNVVKISSPGIADTITIVSEAVSVDSTQRDRDFALRTLDDMSIEEFGKLPYNPLLVSANLALRGSRFILTWTERNRASGSLLSQKIEGSVERSGSRLWMKQDTPATTEYFRTVYAIVVADGRLHVLNVADTWPFVCDWQIFVQVP